MLSVPRHNHHEKRPVNSPTPTSAMSAREAREREREAAIRREVGSVVRRPAAEVVEEMEVLARVERRRVTTPIPPAPRPQGRF